MEQSRERGMEARMRDTNAHCKGGRAGKGKRCIAKVRSEGNKRTGNDDVMLQRQKMLVMPKMRSDRWDWGGQRTTVNHKQLEVRLWQLSCFHHPLPVVQEEAGQHLWYSPVLPRQQTLHPSLPSASQALQSLRLAVLPRGHPPLSDPVPFTEQPLKGCARVSAHHS